MDTPRQTTAALQVAVKIAKAWKLTDLQFATLLGPALQKMLMPGTEGLKHVRQYLDGWRA